MREDGEVPAGPHHVIAAQSGGRHPGIIGCSDNRLVVAILNVAPHELVKRQLGSQHQQVAVQLDPSLAIVLQQAQPLPIRRKLEQRVDGGLLAGLTKGDSVSPAGQALTKLVSPRRSSLAKC